MSQSPTAAPLLCIDRHRLTIDGEGVTTLVAFHGCPLIIPDFNTFEDRKHSRQILEGMGFERFDEFEYVVR